MKYLIDAQLPKRLSVALQNIGYDSVHTLDLPDQNRTKDRYINTVSLKEQRVVISKDSDFIDSILISGKPFKLLYVATGNISNTKLLKLFLDNIQEIDHSFATYRLIELTPETLIIHQ
ncbi:MAG: DUF5615 family PIN-like protein [Desulfamplus sp.]|nr:DUF5615 family PIN-like protein [Desulfamplus sp.]